MEFLAGVIVTFLVGAFACLAFILKTLERKEERIISVDPDKEKKDAEEEIKKNRQSLQTKSDEELAHAFNERITKSKENQP
jgi:hypothetical protein